MGIPLGCGQRRTRPAIAGLEDAGSGHGECGQPLGAGKGREPDPP